MQHRLSDDEGMELILAQGGEISPLFSAPWMSLSSLRLDWLHVVDQGISPVYLGGLFHMVLHNRAYGANIDARLGRLWAEIQDYYNRSNTADRLNNLTLTMIKPKKGSIEMSGSGAKIRALIPFADEMVNSWVDPLSPEVFVAKAGMMHLSRCYFFLNGSLQPQVDSLLDNALAIHSSLLTFHTMNKVRWQLRPKLHMFMEMCFEGGTPSSSWNYREESFGGSVSRQSHRRGGLASPLAMSRSTFTKFCCKENRPRLY